MPIWSGVAIATSKSVKPSSTRLARSAEPTTSAPASSASRAFSPSAKTATRASRPVPCGSIIVPRSCSSAWRTLRPEVHVHLDRLVELGGRRALQQPDRLDRRVELLAVDRRRAPRCSACRARPSGLHLHAHRAGGAGDHEHRLLDVARVQVDASSSRRSSAAARGSASRPWCGSARPSPSRAAAPP